MWQSSLAVLAMVPTALQILRRQTARDHWFWLALALGLAGPSLWAFTHLAGSWQLGFSQTLWATAAVTMLMFGLVAVTLAEAWRLAGLLGTYLIVVVLLALLWQTHGDAGGGDAVVPAGWIKAHVIFALATYALVTLAAVAAFAAILQGTALKRRWRSGLTAALPSLADCDLLQLRLLQWGEAVLAAGLLTGIAVEYVEAGRLFELSHKIVFTLAAFLVIGGLLVAHHNQGIRGRAAARYVLLGYLLLTLGYPGVKFVTDVLMGSPS
ncbi:MAG: cytochrome c biogenesis protein CcsA [Rhodospirillales bacterium]